MVWAVLIGLLVVALLVIWIMGSLADRRYERWQADPLSYPPGREAWQRARARFEAEKEAAKLLPWWKR